MAGMARAALIPLLTLAFAGVARSDGRAVAGVHVRAADGGAVELRNNSPLPVSIAPDLAIEQRESGAWKDTHIAIEAIATCFGEEGKLKATDSLMTPVTLQAQQRLAVVNWRGFTCGKQCPRSCGFNLYLGSGPFRYVATVLPDGEKVRSKAFTMPRRPANWRR